MGCLNSSSEFDHVFGNIHLSGPCNRACYFCIGQHMMALDPYNNLKTWPLSNIDKFIGHCINRNVREVNVTGSNTDPLLYHYTAELKSYLTEKIPGLVFGLRTNAAALPDRTEVWNLYDKASITICSFDPDIYRKMMGEGTPPNLEKIINQSLHMKDIKINIVLGPENINKGDLFKSFDRIAELGIRRINIREPYGQPNIGNPMSGMQPARYDLGMPSYHWGDKTLVTYWNVHYVEVESVNLYANGEVSETYPITKGHDIFTGKVLDQSNFSGGRIQEQWQYKLYSLGKKSTLNMLPNLES